MRKKTCSKCDNLLEEHRFKSGRNYCLKCHSAYMRENRRTHSELSPLQKLKANCRSYLNTYLRRGKIKKEGCFICGDLNSQAHHEDYTKPLEVRWYCRDHHLEYHKLLNK